MSSGGPKQKPELKVDTTSHPDGGTESRNEDGVSPLTPEEEQGNRPKSPQFAETAACDLPDIEPTSPYPIEMTFTAASPTPDHGTNELRDGSGNPDADDRKSSYLTVDTPTNASGNTTEEAS
jgi:hypothetical protein